MAVKKNILIGIVKSFIKIINMKKILLFVLITLTTVFVSNAQRNYSITRVQIKDPNSGSWSELMTYSKLNLIVDENKNIQFYDDNFRLMEILSEKKYVGEYDNISFSNKGLDSGDPGNGSNGVFGYNGKIVLNGKNNFSTSGDAYASFIYYPGTSNLGMIEIRNKLCMCYVRLTIK
jgi:hypothetical protein